MWFFKKHVCEIKMVEKTVHVPCVPGTIRLEHVHSQAPRPRPRYAYVETQTPEGMPLRGGPVSIGNSSGPFYLEVLIPKTNGGFFRENVRLFLDY